MANDLDLIGLELDVQVAKLEGHTVIQDPMNFKDGSWWIWDLAPHINGGTDIHKSTMVQIGSGYSPSTNWAQGGAIIECERIALLHDNDTRAWVAVLNDTKAIGGTALTAAMRAYVVSKTGTEQ
jgi:hypothetical protein